MKQLATEKVTKLVKGRVYCPHCDGPQDDLSEYGQPGIGQVFKCENCWGYYSIPKEVFDRARRSEEHDPIMAALSALQKRVLRLEKELGIK